ncbi:Flp pilus assembly protein CpaB [Tsuneonella sp. SYSU-LHT278]|uniref:Flp pilus assembly protein CpaB n=1 Tax=Tsuneonella sediminis TaxID=3416089 RepID=UPI003F7A4C73
MGGQRNLIIAGVAVLLGLFAVFIANAYFSGIEERQARVAEKQKLARIVVASQPLAFGTRLSTNNVRLANWPQASVPQGAFRTIEAALQQNRVALRPIVVGEPVLADKVSGRGGRATLAANLPEGMRAVSVPVNEVTGVSGFVLPGTTVDVLLTRQMPGEGAQQQDQMVDVVMENVQVLAIDQNVDEKSGEPKPGRTATLQTDLYGAQQLTLAQKLGSLSLALRNVESQEPGNNATVTARDLPGGRFYRPARAQRSAVPVNYSPSVTAPVAAGAATLRPTAPAYSGPSMAVYRGVEKSDYEIGRLGGR